LYQTAEDLLSLPLEEKLELHVEERRCSLEIERIYAKARRLLKVIWFTRKDSALDRSTLL